MSDTNTTTEFASSLGEILKDLFLEIAHSQMMEEVKQLADRLSTQFDEEDINPAVGGLACAELIAAAVSNADRAIRAQMLKETFEHARDLLIETGHLDSE